MERKAQMTRRPNQAICTHHVSVYGIASPITTPWTCNQRKRIKGGVESSLSVAALQEARHEVAGQTGTRVFLGAEVLHDVGELLPVVEGFLCCMSALNAKRVVLVAGDLSNGIEVRYKAGKALV
jgi:hypothetical protein